ncbi:hypothetical protein BLA29_008508, partial [Euroglyphus maynei]
MSICCSDEESIKWFTFLDQFIFHCKKCDQTITSLVDGSNGLLSKHLIRLAVCDGYPMELFFYCFVGKTFNKKCFPINYQHCVFMASSTLTFFVQENPEQLIYWDVDNNHNVRANKPQSLPEMADITERLLKYPRSLWNRPYEIPEWHIAFKKLNRKFYLEYIDIECLFSYGSNRSQSFVNQNEPISHTELMTLDFKQSRLFLKRKIRSPLVPKISAQINESLIARSKSLQKRPPVIPYDPKKHVQMIGPSTDVFKRPQPILKQTKTTSLNQ